MSEHESGSSVETQPLEARRCVPCRGGVAALTDEDRAALLTRLRGWEVVDAHHLSKQYAFVDFMAALAFVNRIGAIAEENGHHPDIHLSFAKLDWRSGPIRLMD